MSAFVTELLWIWTSVIGLSRNTPSTFEEALRHLRLRYLDVKWDFDHPIVADVTGDGIDDLALTGRQGQGFAIGLIIGPIGPLAMMQSMVWPPAPDRACVYQAAPTLAPEALALPPDPLGCRSADVVEHPCGSFLEQDRWIMNVAGHGTKALRVGGDDCDDMHLYWSVKSKSLESWIAR